MEQADAVSVQWDGFLEKQPNGCLSAPQAKRTTAEDREAFRSFDTQLEGGEDSRFEWEPKRCETQRPYGSDVALVQPETVTKLWDNHLAQQPQEYLRPPNERWISLEEEKVFAEFAHQLQMDSDEPLYCIWQHEQEEKECEEEQRKRLSEIREVKSRAGKTLVGESSARC